MGDITDIYLVIISSTIVLLLALATIISLLFFYQNRQVRNKNEIRLVKEHYEREILKTRLEMRERTLKSISQEIHDNVGQVLSLANLILSSLELEDNDTLKEKIENVMQLVSKSINDLRNISKMMDPENIARQGLSACLQFELSLLEKTGAFVTRFEQVGEEVQIESSKLLLIYRIIQETINNVIKHSKATKLDLIIGFGDSLVISIQDDGIGYDPKSDSQGSGMRNMKSRAELISGKIGVESKFGLGTKITLEVPIN